MPRQTRRYARCPTLPAARLRRGLHRGDGVVSHLGPIGRLCHYTAPLEHIAAAGPELRMIQANPSYRFTSERPQHTSHKYGSHSVSVLALKPVAAPRHISDPGLGGGARVAQVTRERSPSNSTTTEEVER
jgi:hypothetical protein